MDYDLDDEDRQWLAAFNRGQERLPHRRMELLLWRLDTANAEATDSAFLSKFHSLSKVEGNIVLVASAMLLILLACLHTCLY